MFRVVWKKYVLKALQNEDWGEYFHFFNNPPFHPEYCGINSGIPVPSSSKQWRKYF